MSENTQKQNVQNEVKKPRIAPITRMIANYYEAMGYITFDEKDDFIKELNVERQGLIGKINAIILAVLSSILGTLFAPIIVRWSHCIASKLDYASEEDEIRAEMKKTVLNETLADLKGAA